jgi:hypothetical protein
MVMASPEPSAIDSKSPLGYFAAFILHTYLVYTCAIHLSQWLVFHWFRWVAPIFNVSTSIPPPDWYLQHFELMTILPALVMGYINVARFLLNTVRTLMHEVHHSIATWAWVLPTLVLLYRMREYRAPASVLYGTSITALTTTLKYFFVIQTVAPTLQNPFIGGDPIRLWAQFSVTAPFYAGVAYSLGALLRSGTFARNAHPEGSLLLPAHSAMEA